MVYLTEMAMNSEPKDTRRSGVNAEAESRCTAQENERKETAMRKLKKIGMTIIFILIAAGVCLIYYYIPTWPLRFRSEKFSLDIRVSMVICRP